MLHDHRQIAILPIHDDEEMTSVAKAWKGDHLRLGSFGKSFEPKEWDKSMFKQSGVDFNLRWDDASIPRDFSREFEQPDGPYGFMHDDFDRGFRIKKELLPKIRMLAPNHPRVTPNIFDYCRLIENATEIHVIDSCFAILADSLTTLKAKRKVVHLYARPGALPPTYRDGWEILK